MVDYMKILEESKGKISDASYKKLQRHLGKKIAHKFINREGEEDTFEFLPASYDLYVDFMGLSSIMDDEDDAKMMEGAMKLMISVVERSYPDWPEELTKQFIANNFETMMAVIQSIMPKDKGGVKSIKKIQQQLKFVKEERKKSKEKNVETDPKPEESSTEQE